MPLDPLWHMPCPGLVVPPLAAVTLNLNKALRSRDVVMTRCLEPYACRNVAAPVAPEMLSSDMKLFSVSQGGLADLYWKECNRYMHII